jgi:type I restriction enzyme S subunit
MSEWKEYRLGDIALSSDFVANGSFASLKENVKYLDSENYAILIRLYDFHNNWKGPFVYVDEGSFNFLKKSNVEPGDLIIANVGANAGESFLAPPLKKSMTLGPNSILIKGSNCKYLFYYFNSTYGKWQLDSIMTGSAQPKFNKTDLRNLKVKLPSETKQGLIVEILSSLDDKIELNNKINQELETLAQTLFKQWFIDFEFPKENGEPYKSSGGEMVDSELGEIPKGWEVGYLEDVLEFHNGYAFTSKELESENSKESYHVFKMGHIRKGGGLNAEGTKSYFSKSKAQKLSKYVLKKGDLLMCMTDMKGNVALLGHTALMNEDDKYIVNQRVGLLRPKNDVGIDYPYLYILTNSFDFIEELRSRANSGVQVNLSTNEIKKSKILIAPKSINEQFDLITKSFYDKIFEITNENETLRNTRDFLLPKLISGELVINEINN